MDSRLAIAARATGARDYWNERPDPLNWTGDGGANARRRWQQAYDSFLAPATRAAIEGLGDLRGRRVLEVASAQGYGSLHLAERGARVVGVDLSDARCRAARDAVFGRSAGERVRFCAAHAERLPFSAASFDAIFCRDVLMYSDPATVAAECGRVVRPGGQVVFVESLRGHPILGLWRRATEPADYRRMTRHLNWAELGRLGGSLELMWQRPYYLVSTLAFALLFVGRSPGWHARSLAVLERVDRRLLAGVPVLARWAWRGVALYRRPGDDAR